MAINFEVPMTTSHYDYKASIEIYRQEYPFYAVLMAAMRQADTANAIKLSEAFPEVWAELKARHNSPGGYLEGEK